MSAMRDLDRMAESLRAKQASNWLGRSVEAGDAEREAFVAWLKESPLNVHEYLMAGLIDQGLDQLDVERRHDTDVLLSQVDPRVTSLSVGPTPPQQLSRHRRSARTWGYAAAACAALIAVVGSWAWFAEQRDWDEVRTGLGQHRVVQLDDGSVVHMNAHSLIAVRYTATERDVKLLDGEALFDVRHDEQRPFRVHARDAVIRNIGTRYNVKSQFDGMKIAVIEGSVEITATSVVASASAPAAQGSTLTARAGHVLVADEEARVDREGSITVAGVDMGAGGYPIAIAWQQRRLVYRMETLAHIVEDFNRYNRLRIRLEGEDVKRRLYSGVFNADDPLSFAQALTSDPELRVERSADVIVVRGAQPVAD